MKYSAKFTLEIHMKEFYEMAIPKTKDIKEIHQFIKDELRQCWHGITEGSFGGSAIDDWKSVFYWNL